MRDRSWGPRPQGPDPRQPARPPTDEAARAARPPRPREGVGYPFATADERNGWLAYTRPTVADGVAGDELSTGYLLRDGGYGHLGRGGDGPGSTPRRWIRRTIWRPSTSRRECGAARWSPTLAPTRDQRDGPVPLEWDGPPARGGARTDPARGHLPLDRTVAATARARRQSH